MSFSFCIEYNQHEALKLQQAEEVWNRENKIDQVKCKTIYPQHLCTNE